MNIYIFLVTTVDRNFLDFIIIITNNKVKDTYFLTKSQKIHEQE